MKRAVLLILLVMLVAWFAAVRSPRHRRGEDWAGRPHQPAPWVSHEARRAASEARREADRTVRRARAEARRALAEVRHGLHAAHQEARGELAEVGEDVREAIRDLDDEIRESVEGIPVPIVHGSREDRAVPVPPSLPDLPDCPLAEAPAAPPAPPEPPAPPARVKKHKQAKPPVHPAPPAAAPGPRETREIEGQISITEELARDDARQQLDGQVAEWLEREGVPRSWRPPQRLVDAMIVGTAIKPVVKDHDPLYKDYETLYIARLTVDVSPERRAGLVEAYQRQVVGRRMVLFGGGLAFLLTCLGAVSGYIRADEATKGYYTNRLRLVAAAGVGAAGMALYRMLA